ncbi:MAG: hypothetical protein WBX11_10510 [Thiobacillaceae bacterium]
MASQEPPFSLLDESAIAAVELRRDPYDYAFVEPATPLRFKDEVPSDAPRMSLQFCFSDSRSLLRSEYIRHGISAFAKSVPLLEKIIEWAPK